MLIWEEKDRGPTKAIAIGSVQNTIRAKVPPRLRERTFSAKDFLCGFQGGSPEGFSSLGESLIKDGLCYTASSKEGGKLISGEKFIASGMFLLPKDARPNFHVGFDAPLSLDDFFQKVYGKLRAPVAFTGYATGTPLNTMKILKPPIDGKPIFDHLEYYFPKPPEVLHEKRAFLMGLFTSEENFPEELSAALYKNPFDSSSLESHTHALILKGKEVEDCVHLFTDKTVLKEASFDLYIIDGLDAF